MGKAKSERGETMKDEVRCAYCSIVFANLAQLDEHECTATELSESITPGKRAQIERLFKAYAQLFK